MQRSLLFITFCLLISVANSTRNRTETRRASVNRNDIDKLRDRKIIIKPIDLLSDLNQKSIDVITIVERLKKLDQKGFEMLAAVPDNSTTCSTKVKDFIRTTMHRAKHICDHCIEKHFKIDDFENRLELNVEQKKCILDILIFPERDMDELSEHVEKCLRLSLSSE